MCGNWQTCTNSWLSKVVLKLCLLLISNHHHPPCLSLRAHAVCAPSLLQRVGTLMAYSLNIPSGLYFFITLSLLGIMWITGMCECLSWVLPSLSYWGSCGSLGCVSACHECSPPSRCRRWTCGQWVCRLHLMGVSSQASCIKGQSEVDHVGQMGCTGVCQWPPPLKPLWFWLYHILLLMYSVFAFLLIFYPYLAVAFQMCSVELGWPPSLHTVHLISHSFLF